MLRIGQVGIGYWGKNLLRVFSSTPGVALTAVCETDAKRRDSLAAAYPGVCVTEDFEHFVQRDDVDAVVIATQTPDHFAMAERALRADKHVFVEKPMARTVAEAEALVELADRRGLTLMTGHLLLYHPAFEHVERLIAEGRLGDVFYMYSTRVNLGIVRSDENALESLMPHDFALALHLLKSKPAAISAQGRAFLQPNVEDVVFATVHFEDGKMAHFHASWLDPHKARKVTIVGSQMMAVIDDVETVEKVRLYDKGVDIAPGEGRPYNNYVESMTLRTGDITIPKIDMREPLARECAHFVESVTRGTTPKSDGRNGLAVVRLMEAGMRSLREGGKLQTL